MKIVKKEIKLLQEDSNNVRKHNQANIEAITKSLKNFGQQKPIVIKDNVVIAGNGTLQASKILGWEYIDTVEIPSDWTEEKIRAYAIADNKTHDLSDWDNDLLLESLNSLNEFELDVVGFDEKELDDLIEFQDKPFKTIRIDVDDLKEHPKNYQEHPDKQLEEIIASIEDHGFYRNIVIAKDNTILAGHGVVLAVKKMGRKRVPVIKLNIDPNDTKALRVLTSDNEISNSAKVDDRALSDLLKEILEIDGDIKGTGFNEDQLSALVFTTRPASEIESHDTANEWVGMDDFKPYEDEHKLVIRFENQFDKEELMEKIGVTLVNKEFGKTSSIWYPERPRENPSAIFFDEQ